MIDPKLDKELMRQAVNLSRASVSENDGRIHPFVGAVIVDRNGRPISSGYRGQHAPGNHAEQEALVDVPDDVLNGAVAYSTLEPCTFRGKQTPCCLRLIDKNIGEVVIGIPDPNRDIRGMGWWKFLEKKIAVRTFHQEFVEEILNMNEQFIDDQLGPGLVIAEIQPVRGGPIQVTEHHRAGREVLAIPDGQLIVRGTYRSRPSDGHRLRLFIRRQNSYFPQAPLRFGSERDTRQWEGPSAWVLGSADGVTHEIIIADLSEDLLVATRHYSAVYAALKDKFGYDAYVGIPVEPEPPGFKRRASLTVRAMR